jgi:tetratricopeptide (TPR) repeat protein
LEAERKAQEQTRLEAERKAQEQAKLEAERKAQEQTRLEAERKAQEQAKLEAERKAQEQAKLEAERQNRQTTLQAALPKPDPLSGIRPYEVALSSQFSPPKRQSCRRVRINTIVARVCDGDSADEGASDTAPPTNTPEFYVKRGNERSALGNIRQGIDDYTQAIALNPDYATAYFNRGYYRYKAGEIDQARSDFAKAISLFESQGKLTEVEKVKAILSKI